MRFAIGLGEGSISPAGYLRALRLAMANPNAVFKQSFRDPRGWTGGHTGAEIVREHLEMLADRWASWHPVPGKGNRARRRAAAIADRKAECAWCGQPTGAVSRRFCDGSCARSYHS